MTETEIPQANGSPHLGAAVAGQAVLEQRAPADTPPPGVWRGPQDATARPKPAPPTDDDQAGEGDQPVPVDRDPRRDPAPLPWATSDTRRPVVPAWVLDSAQRRAAATWALRWTGHATVFHLIRVPKYATRTAYYSPRGAIRAVYGAQARALVATALDALG